MWMKCDSSPRLRAITIRQVNTKNTDIEEAAAMLCYLERKETFYAYLYI